MKRFVHIVSFVFLTMLTQVGGIIYLFNLLIFHKLLKPKKLKWIKRQMSFIALYTLLSLIAVPMLAKFNSRRHLPVFGRTCLQPQNWFTVVCNRHYVHEDLFSLINDVAIDFNNQSKTKTEALKLNYLDANFPFIDGFPLVPHLSHNDGKKMDIAFRYKSRAQGLPMNKTTSLLGYGVFESPQGDEIDQTAICRQSSRFYDATKYIGVATNDWMMFDLEETRRLMELLSAANSAKIFIEPHLKQRMGLRSDKIRFHGCHAVRHDDHIHLQVH